MSSVGSKMNEVALLLRAVQLLLLVQTRERTATLSDEIDEMSREIDQALATWRAEMVRMGPPAAQAPTCRD